MKILALIKYSLDTAEIKVNPATKELLMTGVPAKIGNIDKNVVEAAVQLKEAAGGTLQALSFGPACAAWSVAVNLNEWPGTTRSSWSPVVTSVAG